MFDIFPLFQINHDRTKTALFFNSGNMDSSMYKQPLHLIDLFVFFNGHWS